MADTVNITGPITETDSTAWASAVIKFRLVTSFATTAVDTVLNNTYTVTCDANGDFDIDLPVPDAYAWRYECELPDGNKFYFNLSSDDGPATTLHALITVANLSTTVSASSTLSAYLLKRDILDEDDMASDSAVYPATQQSVKAYVDAGGGGAIGNLSDVTITTPADNEVLAYDGVDTWINQTAAEAGLAAATHATAHTDGTDDIQDATAAQKGLATAAQITKLDGIETAADVTDATNVDAAGAVMEADYDANTVLAATADNTPAALTVPEQTVVGRITAGNIDALTAAEVRTLINVEDGAGVTDATNVAAAGALMTSGGTMSGDIAMADNSITRAVLKDTGEDGESASVSGSKDLDIAAQGNNFDLTLTANTTLTFSNPSASGTWCAIALILRQGGVGSYTITWPGSVDWGDAGEPTLKTGVGDYDILTFLTVDAGTTWIGTSPYADELATHTALTAAHGATGAVVGTTNTQTLTNKTLGGATLSGELAAADNTISRAVLKDYGEDTETEGTSGAAKTLDIAAQGNTFDVTLSANCTFTFSNPSASGTACSITLICRQDGTGSRTVTWPASVDWPAATAPTLSTGANDVDVFTFLTVDAGTTWLGFTAGLDLS